MMHKFGFVSIIGRPNAGKSTLLNAILNEKLAITSNKPNTTRTQIRGIKSGNNYQIVFIDTPGIHNARDRINKLMVQKAEESAEGVDLIYFLIEAGETFGKEYQQIIKLISGLKCKKFLIITKVDIHPKEAVYKTAQRAAEDVQYDIVLPISSIKDINIEKLLDLTIEHLDEGDKCFDEEEITTLPEKSLIAEFIREQVFALMDKEIPYDVFVECEKVEDRNDDLLYAAASIVVNRQSQKGIIIGKNGSSLKKIGRNSRISIEKFFGVKVFLDLWVKVREDWQMDNESLRIQGILD